MKPFRCFLVGLTPALILASSCGPSQDKLLDVAANLVIAKYQNASCEEVAQMQPQAGAPATDDANAALQQKAIEMLKNNPEMREKFINRVAGPIANKMFDCNLVP